MHQTEYQIEEHMYRVYMESGEDSGDYQELVRMREDVASKHWMMVGGGGHLHWVTDCLFSSTQKNLLWGINQHSKSVLLP